MGSTGVLSTYLTSLYSLSLFFFSSNWCLYVCVHSLCGFVSATVGINLVLQLMLIGMTFNTRTHAGI